MSNVKFLVFIFLLPAILGIVDSFNWFFLDKTITWINWTQERIFIASFSLVVPFVFLLFLLVSGAMSGDPFQPTIERKDKQ